MTATSTDGVVRTTSIAYSVGAPPTAAVSAPASGGAYTVGQSVPEQPFTCAGGAGSAALASCDNSNGTSTASGGQERWTPRPWYPQLHRDRHGLERAQRHGVDPLLGDCRAGTDGDPDTQSDTDADADADADTDDDADTDTDTDDDDDNDDNPGADRGHPVPQDRAVLVPRGGLRAGHLAGPEGRRRLPS